VNGSYVRLLLIGFAGLAVALAIVNGELGRENRVAQVALSERQQYLNESTTLARIHEALVRALGEAAIKGDDKARAVLSDNGITLSPAPAAPVAPNPVAQPKTSGGSNGGH